MHHDPGARNNKIRELSQLTRSFDIIALQEVHGSSYVLEMEQQGCLRSHVFLSSHQSDEAGNIRHDTAGLAFLVKRRGSFV